MTFFKRIIEKGETCAIHPVVWIGTFSALVLLRNFLEALSTREFEKALSFDFFLHAWTFYFLVFIGIAIFIKLATGERIEKTTKIVLFIAPLILLPPLADLLVTHGSGSTMAYRSLPGGGGVVGLLGDFWNFLLYGPYGLLFWGRNEKAIEQLGINYGIRIEILLYLLIFSSYIFIKTKNILRTLFGLGAIYVGTFLLGTFPYIVGRVWGNQYLDALFLNISNISRNFSGDNLVLAGLYLWWIVGAALFWYYLYDKRKFFAVVKNIRPLRLIVNLLSLGTGMAIAAKSLPSNFLFTPFDWVIVGLAGMSVAAYWIWTVGYNDLADEDGDRVSMQNRPLPQGHLTREELGLVSWTSLAISLVAAFFIGPAFLAIIITRFCLGFLYSSPPFRIKRIPILANALLGSTYLLTMIAGYFTINGGYIFDFPARVVLVMIVGYTLGIGFKDIKDYEGDKVSGVHSLPVIFGPEIGRKIVGGLGAFAFLFVAIVYREYFSLLIIPTLVAGLGYYWVCTQNPYDERKIFVIYFLFIACMAFFYSQNLLIL